MIGSLNNNATYQASVIIPTYNRSELLDYTLRSLTRQYLAKEAFEVIVADDGSSEDTLTIVRKYMGEGQLNIRYCWQKDAGYRPGSARNMGIKLADGEVCILIDSGVLLAPDAVQQHIWAHQFAQQPSAIIGYVYGFEQFDTNGDSFKRLINVDDIGRTTQRLEHTGLFSDIREPYYQRYNDDIADLPAPWIFFWTCNVSVRREDLLSIGLFDPHFDGIWGVEDNDLAIRLQQAGNRITFNRAAVAIHYPHDKGSEEKFKLCHQNRLYLHQKHNTLATCILAEAYGEECTDLNERVLATVAPTNDLLAVALN